MEVVVSAEQRVVGIAPAVAADTALAVAADTALAVVADTALVGVADTALVRVAEVVVEEPWDSHNTDRIAFPLPLLNYI